ncbi:Stk1 family PASTA domain-containing Ser/Thr kinase [Paenibacillus agricola]|uniref:PASTA domain-containing protein n=1 Tax=Paenibacillus agricola TaxID=2716264 RepID=A0ABX0IWJ4_9BACL|nr:Stk1 family PASTA domain-containing Ser/Thr kinase [Paenibacillus agricola]NHN28267.1 PASTA domain-containing protein [Paenibacillus agricola]
MDTHTYKRYTAEQVLQTQSSGNLYKGHDSVLHRDVMLYISEFDVSVDSGPSVIQAVKNGSQLPEDRFMHVWDIEVDALSIMIVLKPELGYFLADELTSHSLNIDEILAIVRQIGQSMQESAKDGIYGYSVYANNIWIQGLNQPIIINYWNHDEPLWSGAGGLGRLLYQLAVRTKKLPTDIDALDASLLQALSGLPNAKKEAISRWMRAALQDRKSLTLLLQGLDQLLLTHQERGQQEVEDEETSKDGQEIQDDPDQYEDTIILPAIVPEKKYAPLVQELAPRRPTIKKEPKPAPAAAEIEPDKKMSKKKKWIIAGAVLGALLVTEIFAVELLRNPDSTPKSSTVTEPPVVQNPVPQPVVPAPTTPAPVVPKPTTDSETAIVPNLKGLSVAEADTLLKSLRLRYKYTIEANEQSAGLIFKQELPADQQVAVGTEVTFYVGK